MAAGRRPRAVAAALAVLALAAGCGPEESGPLPAAPTVEGYYTYPHGLEAEVQGSVVELRAVQPAEQLRRGGRLWARVGPYVLLFSEETRRLFEDFPALTAVRAVTRTPEGEEVARAYLPRNALTGITWRRALNIAGRARQSGTERPTLLEELVRWGEDHTDYRYAPAFQDR